MDSGSTTGHSALDGCYSRPDALVLAVVLTASVCIPASSSHIKLPWHLTLWAEQPGVLCRYVMPLLVAATFAGSMKYVLSMRQWSAWVTPASGVLLLAGGTYSLLSRAFPA